MGEIWTFVLDIVVVLGAAAVLGIIAERLRLGSVIGYLIAGVVVGPGALGLVRTGDVINVIAEVGVALLLFTIGLEFSWKQLVRFGGRALVGSAIAIVATILVAVCVGLGIGVGWQVAFVLGAGASLGSTAIVLRILRDKNDMDSVHGRFATAVLLTQDIALVPLVLVVSFVSTQSGNLAESMGAALINTIILVIVLILFVSLIIPRLLSEKVIAKNREIPILIAITTAVGATWAAHSVGVSPALGAFFAGLLLAEGKWADQMRADALPLRTLFMTVFFVSVGLLADIPWVWDNLPLVLGISLALILAKVVITYFATRAFQPSIVECLAAAIATAQVGEFSFVIFAGGFQGGLISEQLFRLVTSVTLITLFATPFMTGNCRNIALRVAKLIVPKRKLVRAERLAHGKEKRHGHIVLMGYGAAGSAAARMLRDSGEKVTVLDINAQLVREAEGCGMDAILGDATQTPILEHAHVEGAKAIVTAIPDYSVTQSIVSQCKHLAPEVPVFARARYHVHSDELGVIGADYVVDEEETVGFRLGSLVADFLSPSKPADTPDDGHSLR